MLEIEGDRLTYKLSWLECLGAFGRSPRAAVSNLREISFDSKPWTMKVLRGIRAPGTGFPYVIMLGTMRHRKGKDFCLIYKKNPVILIEFKNEKFARWVIPDTLVNRSLLESIN